MKSIEYRCKHICQSFIKVQRFLYRLDETLLLLKTLKSRNGQTLSAFVWNEEYDLHFVDRGVVYVLPVFSFVCLFVCLSLSLSLVSTPVLWLWESHHSLSSQFQEKLLSWHLKLICKLGWDQFGAVGALLWHWHWPPILLSCWLHSSSIRHTNLMHFAVFFNLPHFQKTAVSHLNSGVLWAQSVTGLGLY